MSSLFSEKKAAEVAAYFLLCASKKDASLTRLKLMKLMYLGERLSYERFGFPIIGDALVSMPHGPVLSKTYDLINAESDEGPWNQLIVEKSGSVLCISDHEGLTDNDLRELSESDIEVLGNIWQEFGRISAIELRDYTHDSNNCPEWQDPDGSSTPIQLETLLAKLGYAAIEVSKIIEGTRKQAWINSRLLAA